VTVEDDGDEEGIDEVGRDNGTMSQEDGRGVTSDGMNASSARSSGVAARCSLRKSTDKG
jgi:hypothetical protein